ncbi:MAG TPA: aminodeoxychorismate synthase component I [Gemmatimonadaceae bacterium]|nr:aminodeoxychorismate synthase component I [Gemmatimonadaceae bacterium]
MTDAPVVQELVPAPDPVESCARFADLPYRIFLDSARDPERLGRYSFLAADPATLVRSKGAHTECIALADGATHALDGHALRAARALLAPHTRAARAGLPPFQGGVAGYIAYDWGAQLERLPAPRYDDLAISDVVLGLYDWVVAWDHLEQRAWIISTGLPCTGDERDRRAAERLAMVRNHLSAPSPEARRPDAVAPARDAPPRAPSYPVREPGVPASLDLRSSFTHRGYLDAVERVREYILAGDIFEANLSQRLEAPLREPPWSLYCRLRAINPAPFAAFLDFGDVRILSASPERFLRLTPERDVEARPIKGTSARGISPEHDAALGRALADSAKDRAENLMIVDLLRNDLSRVCVPGTVRAPELFALEHYSTVHHLVSTVIGRLAPGADAVDLLEATFPGGSITGAPKIRAMEIIAELEPSRRGVYCGSIGYLSVTGALDLSIVIRTYLALEGRVYFSVGGAITVDSDPEQEYLETLAKGRALIAGLR